MGIKQKNIFWLKTASDVKNRMEYELNSLKEKPKNNFINKDFPRINGLHDKEK